MVYKILVTETAKKQLAKINRQDAKRIDVMLREIEEDPFHYVTRLVGLELYKLRVGDYRVLMSIQKYRMLIMVAEISHRSNVYK